MGRMLQPWLCWGIMITLTMGLASAGWAFEPPGEEPRPSAPAPAPPEGPRPPPAPPAVPGPPLSPPTTPVPSPPTSPLPSERAAECPPEVWQAWEARKNQAREWHQKRLAEMRESYINRIRYVYQSYDKTMQIFTNDPDTIKGLEKVRDKRIKELETEMQRQLDGAQKYMEKELAELDRKQKECARLDGAPTPPPPLPPVAEKPEKCPEAIKQYWQDKIRQARTARDRGLQQLETNYNRDRKNILEECKRKQEKFDKFYEGPLGLLRSKESIERQLRYDDDCLRIAKAKLNTLRINYRRARDNAMEYWRDIINGLEESLKACRKP